MTLRTDKQRRRQHDAPPSDEAAKVQQEADFTSEGSPLPGRVGTDQPALPRAGHLEPAEPAKPAADAAGGASR